MPPRLYFTQSIQQDLWGPPELKSILQSATFPLCVNSPYVYYLVIKDYPVVLFNLLLNSDGEIEFSRENCFICCIFHSVSVPSYNSIRLQIAAGFFMLIRHSTKSFPRNIIKNLLEFNVLGPAMRLLQESSMKSYYLGSRGWIKRKKRIVLKIRFKTNGLKKLMKTNWRLLALLSESFNQYLRLRANTVTS